MAPRHRMDSYSAIARLCGLGRGRISQPTTTRQDRKRCSDSHRLHPVVGSPGSPPTHFVAAADPLAMLGSYMVHPPAPAFSTGVTPAKNMRAVLRDSSLQQLIVWGGISRPGRPRLMENRPDHPQHRALHRPAWLRTEGSLSS